MNLFSVGGKREKLYLVFDVGSSSVGGALFGVSADGTPRVVASIREPITLEEGVTSDRFLFLTAKSLEIVAGKIASLGSPSRIFVVLSAPWHVSQTRIIKLKKEESFVFTTSLADDLIKKETELFKKDNFTPYLEAGSDVRLIELKNIKVSLNGYETTMPLNQKASELEMAIFLTMGADEVLKKFEEVIHQHAGVRKIEFSSYALASFTAVRDFHKPVGNFLLVDIGGEMTEVAMVKNDTLHESISFPLGRNYLIRGAAFLLSCTLSEAETCIALFKDGHASYEARKKLEPLINKLRTDWLTNFQKALADLSNDISVPATIYLSVDDELEEFFIETIKSEQFSQHTLTESKFEIIPLNNGFFHDLVSYGKDTPRDAFLTLDSIYANRLLINMPDAELVKVSLQGKI